MAIGPNETAKRVLIAYRQLSEIAKDNIKKNQQSVEDRRFSLACSLEIEARGKLQVARAVFRRRKQRLAEMIIRGCIPNRQRRHTVATAVCNAFFACVVLHVVYGALLKVCVIQ